MLHAAGIKYATQGNPGSYMAVRPSLLGTYMAYYLGMCFGMVYARLVASFLSELPSSMGSRGSTRGARRFHYGLLSSLAPAGCAEAHAWDLSEVSLQQTSATLGLLGANGKAHFSTRDMHRIESKGESIELIILGHILEYIENSILALERFLLGEEGLLFVSVPLNAPTPDRIGPLEIPDAAAGLLCCGGLRRVETTADTTQSMSLSRAVSRRSQLPV
jgi:hypothetical protein